MVRVRQEGDKNGRPEGGLNGDMAMEPNSDDRRVLVDRALEAMAAMPPSRVLPPTRELGEELARSISRHKTRHQVVRLIASQYAINGAPADSGGGLQGVEETLAREITKTSAQIQRFIPGVVPEILEELASEYFDQYLDDQAGLSRWLLFCAIATAPGDLKPDDARDREEFREAIAGWLGDHVDLYAGAYGELMGKLGRRDRVDDGYRTLTHALGMLAEGAILRASVDPAIDREEAARTFRHAALGLVAVFTANKADERSVDDLFREVFSPSPTSPSDSV
jgi:hypothetical protein